MPPKKLRVDLLCHTAQPDRTAAMAARICYAGLDVEELREEMDSRDHAAMLRRVMEGGHLSTVEHASFTFAVEGVSRALMAQLTRHRIASFSVQSQRYVALSQDFEYIVPPAIEALGEEAVERFAAQMTQMGEWYAGWRQALGGKGERANEDARFVLPNACATRLIMSMNARELLHFFSLRCCRRAQWEIRALAIEMLRLALEAAPTIFAQAGPGCVRGQCPEGKKSCGQAAQVCAEIKGLRAVPTAHT